MPDQSSQSSSQSSSSGGTPHPPDALPVLFYQPSRAPFYVAIAVAVFALIVSALVAREQAAVSDRQTEQALALATTTAQVAGEAKARAEFNAAINSKLQNGLCDLLIGIADQSTVPVTTTGRDFIRKYRRSVLVFECVHPVYKLPDSAFDEPVTSAP